VWLPAKLLQPVRQLAGAMGDRRGTGGSFEFCPPQRQERAPDAGLPSFGYRPAKGKKSQIYNDEVARINSNNTISVNSPDHFKSSVDFQSDCVKASHMSCGGANRETIRNRRDPNIARPRAAGLTCIEQQHSAALRTHDPARCVSKQAYCSKNSPRWFKNCTERNKGFFETQARDLDATADCYNFEPSAAEAKQMYHDEIQGQMKGHLGNNLYCSTASPDWMKTSFESNRDHFQEYNIPPYRKCSAESDAYRENPIGIKVNIALAENEQPQHPQVVSKHSPRWMKAAYLSNPEYFAKKTGTKLNECVYVQPGFRPRPGHKTSRRNMVSEEHPHWMVSSVVLPADKHPHLEVWPHRSQPTSTKDAEAHRSAVHKHTLQNASCTVPRTVGSFAAGPKPPSSAKSSSKRSSERSSRQAPVSTRARSRQQSARGAERRR